MRLIDKDALVAEIERRLKEYRTYPDYQTDSNYMELCEILSFLNTLEVKEVDLKKEIDEYFKGWGDYQGIDSSVTDQVGCCVTLDSIKDACRHFFELGLKVNNEKEK